MIQKRTGGQDTATPKNRSILMLTLSKRVSNSFYKDNIAFCVCFCCVCIHVLPLDMPGKATTVFFIVSVHLTIMMHVFQFDKIMWLCALDSVNLQKSTKEDPLSFIFSFYTNNSGLFFDEQNSPSDIWYPMRAIIILFFFLIVSISSNTDWNITNVPPVNIFSQFKTHCCSSSVLSSLFWSID